MPLQKKINFEGVTVTTDTRSKSRVVSFPFEFPSGENGALIVCKLKDEKWVPEKEIKEIIIDFK